VAVTQRLFRITTGALLVRAVQPFLTFRSFGSRCELTSSAGTRVQFGNPWHLLDALMSRCEMLDELDLPFPLGGCFGYWVTI
jgi:hypothetical protein